MADPDEPDHDRSAGRAPGWRNAWASRAGAIPERPHLAGGLISQLNPDAAAQSAERSAVRPNSVSREAAAGCLRPWELPALWSPTEEPLAGASDGPARACWVLLQAFGLGSVPARAVEAALPGEQEYVLPVKYELQARRSATAGADRKESGRAAEQAEPDGPESEFRAAGPSAVLKHSLKPAAGAAAPHAESEEHQRESRGPAAQLPPPLRVCEPRAHATAPCRRKPPGRLRLCAREFPFQAMRKNQAIRSILR